jgi:hypothetical protein
MATVTTTTPRAGGMTKDERFVIFASSLGTVFEWYDFYLYGSLAAIIGAQFFSAYPPATRDIFALLAFAAGFLVRPFGAIVFGRIGDLVGRKYTFLVTILIMGLSTFIVGLLPNYATIGIAAPIILIGCACCRVSRSAANTVVQPPTSRSTRLPASAATTPRSFRPRRRSACSCRCWSFSSPVRSSVKPSSLHGAGAFRSCSRSFCSASPSWIRLKLNESPAFQKMKEEGKGSKAPLTEAFGNWKQRQDRADRAARRRDGPGRGLVHWPVLCAVLPAVDPEGRRLHREPPDRLVAVARHRLLHRVRRLSDKIGRKPIILAGCLIAALTFFPIFRMISTNANPQLEKATRDGEGFGRRDQRACGDLFNPVGTRVFSAPCDTIACVPVAVVGQV